jgi:two-component system chemotaxis response regulator CheB
MAAKHLVVIGASAGGIEALRDLVGRLPAEFPAPIAIVLHTSPQSPGVLHEILSRSGPLTAVAPADHERLQPGRIYVAPPDFHLLIEPGRVRVTKGPRENRFRPAIDPLFRSAAQVYGPAAIGVILTGNLDDGTAGLWAVKRLGGTAIVQDPNDAFFPSMPQNALAAVAADHVVALRSMPQLLVELTTSPVVPPSAGASDEFDVEVRIAKEEDPMKAGVERLGPPSPLACPECHGVLRELQEGDRIRFRCHTGHAYSVESLLAEINTSIETSLWNAVRAMQEGTMLMHSMVKHAEGVHPSTDTRKLAARAAELEEQVEALRAMMSDATRVTAGDTR